MTDMDGSVNLWLHYINPWHVVKALLDNPDLNGHITGPYVMMHDRVGRRVIGPSVNTGRLYECFTDELRKDCREDCLPNLMVVYGDGSFGRKNQKATMLYCSSSAMDEWARGQSRFWGCFALFAELPPLSKNVRPLAGPFSQSWRRVELMQQQLKIVLAPVLEAEKEKKVVVWPAGGRMIKFALGLGWFLGDLQWIWTFLGESHGTCPLCYVPKKKMTLPFKWKSKTAWLQAMRMIRAAKGEWPGYEDWGQPPGGRKRKAEVLITIDANGKRTPGPKCTPAAYERGRKANGGQICPLLSHEFLGLRDINMLVRRSLSVLNPFCIRSQSLMSVPRLFLLCQ